MLRPGSRVYWHGIFPNPRLQGTVKRTGQLRHEVVWDGVSNVDLVPVQDLAPIVGGKPKCPYDEPCGYCL